MSDSNQPETTVSSTVAPLQGGGIVQQSHSATANKTDVAASTSTAIVVPGGSGTKSTAAAASGGNVVAIETIATEKATGGTISVKDDPRSKLMYYLRCIRGVFGEFYSMCKGILKLDSTSKIDCLLKADEYHLLTMEQCDKVLILCDVLRPNLFINKCFFENSQKCGNSLNKFYKIEETEKSLAIQNEIVIRGEKRQVSKIMYYKQSYFENYYYEPMRLLEHRFRAIRKGEHLETFTENYKVHLLLTIIFPFWVVVWVAMCINESKSSDDEPLQTVP